MLAILVTYVVWTMFCILQWEHRSPILWVVFLQRCSIVVTVASLILVFGSCAISYIQTENTRMSVTTKAAPSRCQKLLFSFSATEF